MFFETKAVIAAGPAAGFIIAAAAITDSFLPASNAADIVQGKSVLWLVSASLMVSSALIGWLVKKLFDIINAFLADRIADRDQAVKTREAIDELAEQLKGRPCALVESGAVRVVLKQHTGNTEALMRATDEETPIQRTSIRNKAG